MYQDLMQIILNFGASLEDIANLIASLSYVIGVIFMMVGVKKLHASNDQRTSTNPMEMGGPIMKIVTGVALIWWPVMLDALTASLWGTTSPIGYDPNVDAEYKEVWHVILNVMKIVGLIAFIRGWYCLTKAGEQGAQGMVGKGLTHIVGGVLAFHMDAVIHVLFSTFGF
jgi:hypothetical protein